MKLKNIFIIPIFLFSLRSVCFACETANFEIRGNLDSSTPVANQLPDPTSSLSEQLADAQFHTAFDIYDPLGDRHKLYIAFYRSSTTAWIMRYMIDAEEVGGESGSSIQIENDYHEIVNSVFSDNGQRGFLSPFQLPWVNSSQSRQLRYVLYISQYPEKSEITINQDGHSMPCSLRSNRDFDSDGNDDLVIWRPSIGYWAVLQSSDNLQYIWKQWGLQSDFPMPGDYTGDGIADLVVWRPASGSWYVCRSDTGFDCTIGTVWQFGLPEDLPISGDFDGDGIFDYAVWRPSLGMFFFKRSRTNEVIMQQWGLPEDIPLIAGRNE